MKQDSNRSRKVPRATSASGRVKNRGGASDTDMLWISVIALAIIAVIILVFVMRSTESNQEKMKRSAVFEEKAPVENVTVQPESKQAPVVTPDPAVKPADSTETTVAKPTIEAPASTPVTAVQNENPIAAPAEDADVKPVEKPAAPVNKRQVNSEDDEAQKNLKILWEARQRAERQAREDFDRGTGIYSKPNPEKAQAAEGEGGAEAEKTEEEAQ